MADITGTNQIVRILGTRGDDVVQGLDGDDRNYARLGKNVIDGGGGDDRSVGGRDDDQIDIDSHI